jgi:hypothetical protein
MKWDLVRPLLLVEAILHGKQPAIPSTYGGDKLGRPPV